MAKNIKQMGSSGANESSSLFSIDPTQNDYLVNFLQNKIPMSNDILKAAESTSTEPLSQASIFAHGNMTASKMKHAETQTESQQTNKLKISQNQLSALKKYPSLIEFLGTNDGEIIAQQVLNKVNEVLAVKIQENSKSINKLASGCKADKHNIKQYFIGENQNWVCVVTASGPFRGDETIHYDESNDKAYILRKNEKNYDNVTAQFNMVFEKQDK